MIQLKELAVWELVRANAGLYAVDRNQYARQGCVSCRLVRKRLLSEVIDAHARVLGSYVEQTPGRSWPYPSDIPTAPGIVSVVSSTDVGDGHVFWL